MIPVCPRLTSARDRYRDKATGPITNHVNIVRNANGMFAYVTIGGLNEIKVSRRPDHSVFASGSAPSAQGCVKGVPAS
jgi:hypothetical protein